MRTPDYGIMAKQLEFLIEEDSGCMPVLSNCSALLWEHLEDINWAGFYLVRGDILVLGPFQGPVACMRIGYGKGVCGTAWKEDRSIEVPDVEEFPGHIACSSLSRSEIVVPMHSGSGEVTGVLDIDSTELSTFDNIDAYWLEKIVCVI